MMKKLKTSLLLLIDVFICKASDADMLNALEGLLKEFYAPNTDNVRKREIGESIFECF
jgi:hypothetical protein